MSMSAGNGSFSDPLEPLLGVRKTSPQTLDPTDGRCKHLASCLKAASTVTKLSGSTRGIGIHPIVESATLAGNGDSYNLTIPNVTSELLARSPGAVMYFSGFETGGNSG